MTSRLQKSAEKQMFRNIFLTVLGITIIIILVVKFGLQFLINFSLNVEKQNSANQTTIPANQVYVAPPVINPLTDATNSATITVSGYALTKDNVELFLNGAIFDKVSVNDDKTFSFQNVKLQNGQNDIKAKTVTNSNQQSAFSNDQTITYSNKMPTLTVDSPQDNQTIKGNNQLTVSGKTDAGDNVTVNDLWAIVNDNGSFSYTITLQNGDNTIKVIATDTAGNATTKQLKVNYSQ